jgi:PKD repeat protein
LLPSPIHVFSAPGQYTVTLTVTNVSTGCKSVTTSTITVTTVGNDFAKIFNLYAAPNPFVGNTKIKYTLPENANSVSIDVYDMIGRKVSTIATNESQDAGTYEFNFENTDTENASGVYMVKLIVDGKVAITRVIDIAKR